MSENTAAAKSTTPAKEATKQLATTVPAAFHAAIDAHHWDVRKKVSDIVRIALEEYAERNGIDVTGKAPAAK